MSENKDEEFEYTVTVYDPRLGKIQHHYLKKDGKQLCWVLGQYNPKIDIFAVIHIVVPVPERGKGYAQQMIASLQRHYKMIYTAFNDSTEEGIGLFYKMGFQRKMIPSQSGDSDVLMWRKLKPKIFMPNKKIIKPKLKIITGEKK